MRIALLTPGFSADERDWCIPALTGLVRELARAHDVRVFTLRYPPRRGSYRAFSAHVHALGGAPRGPLGRASLLARALTRIRCEGRCSPFALLHGMWADEAGFLAVAAGRILGVPAVVSLLGGELVALPGIGYGTGLSPAGRALVRCSLRHADAVTVGSGALAELASRHVPPARLHRLPLGVDSSLFRTEDGESTAVTLPGAPALLHVGSLVPVKDQETLLRAFARVAGELPASRLHVVGDGPLRSRLESLARQLGVGERVTFHGPVAHERLPAYYRAAGLCVLSSRFESQSMVALEAGACGRATVGTAVGVLPELEGATRAVPPGDAAALAGAVLELARDPVRLAAAGKASRAVVLARYTLDGAVAHLEALYGLLAGGGTAA